MNKNKIGFTLVETMIVVAIIAILAAMVIPNLQRARVNSNETAARASLKSVGTAMENYMAINSVYPSNVTQLLGAIPPYLNVDYFTGIHNGYTYTLDSLTDYSYSVTGVPQHAGMGNFSFTITTGAVLVQN